jgi:glycosyltransferase involved in cell wall biosynthesis
MAILEAMACGLPIIATRTGGMPELVHDGLNGFLVPVDDVRALACCLGQVARSAELRARMGRASRDAVDDHHHWGHVAEGYLRLFGEACG